MPARASYQQYTVKSGDTLAKIAKAFSTTVAGIAVTNGIADPNKIKVGQVLSIAVDSGYDPADVDLTEVIVRAKPISSSPKMDPRQIPTMSVDTYLQAIAGGLQDWMKPPKVWFTLAAAAGVGYYLFADHKSSRRRK